MKTTGQWHDLNTFGHTRETTVIADISSNHESDKDILDSIEFLRSRNCFIKLQAYRPGTKGLEHLKGYALSEKIMRHIANEDVFYSVFGTEMVDWLESEINPSFYKLACRSYDDHALIMRLIRTGKMVFQSIPHNKPIPHNYFEKFLCVSEYPAKYANLGRFNDNFLGYSDHTLNPIVPALAVAKGAEIIEHHFSIRDMDTPDQCVSYLPHQWDEMLNNIKLAERHTR